MPFPSLPSPPTLFPTYLVPSNPFRRRQSSIDSTSSSRTFSSAASTSAPPPTHSYLSGHASHLRCARCLSDLALCSQIISKGFTGRHGRAYLVAPSASAIATSSPSASASPTPSPAHGDALPNLPNTCTHKPVPRQLVTGAHTVGDISCARCGSVLGWKYLHAEEESQRYKVGKFILETKRVCRSSGWEGVDGAGTGGGAVVDDGVTRRRSGGAAPCAAPPPPMESELPQHDVEFDSDDEDECELLFLGQWTGETAREIRRAKANRPGGVAAAQG